MAFGALVAVGAFWWNEHRYDVPPPALPLGHDLKITVTASRSIVSPGEEFSLELRIENPTNHPQTFKEMSCSWFDEWHVRTREILPSSWACAKNTMADVTPAPGQADTRTLNPHPADKASSGSFTGKSDGTPIGSPVTYESNNVELMVR